MSSMFVLRFQYRWRRFMMKCRRVFNPDVFRTSSKASDQRKIAKAIKEMRKRQKGKSPITPVEIIGNPLAAFRETYVSALESTVEASIASETALQDLEAMQAFFEEIFDDSSIAYKERTSFSSIVCEPQVGLIDLVTNFMSNCVVGHDVKASVINAANNVAATSLSLDSATAAIVNNTNDITELANSLRSMLSMVPSTTSFSETVSDGILNSIGNFSSGVISNILPHVSFLSFIGAFLFYVSQPCKSTLLIMAFTLAAAIYYNWEAVSKFLKFAVSFIPSFDMAPQAGIDFDGLLYAISILLFGLNVKNSNISALPKNIIEHLKGFKTIKESLKDIISFLMTLLTQILDYASLSEYLPSWAKFLNVTDPEVKNLFVAIDNVNACYANNKFSLTKTNAALVQNLHRQVLMFLRSLPVNQTTTAIRDSLKSELPKLSKLIEVFRAAKLTDDGKRIEPVFALFAGAPGNFKSQMVELLCASLQKATLDPERFAEAQADHFRYVFKREQSNVYWDGFKDPHIVVFDDIGQFKTCVQNIDNEFADVLKGVNELPLPLHMANVDSKGSTYFKARFIIGTTNFTAPKMENINSREAYNRRIALAFYQVPRVEFCTFETRNLNYMCRKLDKKNPKLPKGPHGCILTHPKYHSEFIRYDPHNPNITWGSYTYDQVVEMMVEEYRTKEKFFEQKAIEVDNIYFDDSTSIATDLYMDAVEEEGKEEEEMEEVPLGVPDNPIYDLPEEDLRKLVRLNNRVEEVMQVFQDQLRMDREAFELTNKVLQPQSGISDDFDALCTKAKGKETAQLELAIEDQIIASAYLCLKKSSIDISRKIAHVRFEHMKAFGQRLEGSDEYVFLRACLSTKDDGILPYFSTKVDIHTFVEAFNSRSDVYVANYHDTNIYVNGTEPVDINIKSVWATSFENWKKTIYTSSYAGYKFISEWYGNNKMWINPILAVISAIAVTTSAVAFTKYVSSDSREELDDEDLNFEQEATTFTSTDPVAEPTPAPKKEEVPQSMFYDRGSGKTRLGKARYRMDKRAGKAAARDHFNEYMHGGNANGYYGPEMAMDADPASYDLATRINGSCLLTLTYENNSVSTKMGHALVIADRVTVVPKHFYVMIKASYDKGTVPPESHVRVSFRSTLKSESISTFISIPDYLDSSKWIFTDKLTDLDQALFILPPDSARKYRNITDRIASAEMHKENKIRSGFLMGYDDDQNNLATFKFEPIVGQSVFDPLTGAYSIGDAYSYYANTGKGDCGTPLYVHCRSSAKAKIFGIHVAGTASTGRGVSSILVREYLEEAMSMVPQTCMISTTCKDFELFEEMPFAQNQFVEAHHALQSVSEPGKSKIEKSELYEEWGPATTKAAYLRKVTVDGVEVDVKEKAYSKVCIGIWRVPEKVLKDVEDTYFADMMQVSKFDVEKRNYTFEEAVCGLKDDPNFGAIARNTSPGYPFILDPKVKRSPGKRYWFGIDQHYDMDNPRVAQLKMECEGIIDQARKGVRSEHIFVDCLKDERRPIEKANQGKTRMINSGPMRLLIIMRMYFGAFANWFTQNRVLNGSAIGVNPYSNEWDEIARNLKKFGTSVPNVGAGDYSGYDGSEKPQVHNAILNIINRWYDDGPENELIRTVLWAEVVNSKHISGNVIYSWTMSLPSGHPLTALINTIYNGLAFRYCWLRAVDGDRTRLPDFLKNVYTIMLGDDNVYTVHPDMVAKFNDINLENWMAEFGLTYTNETKSGTMSELRKLEEVAFLKRTFRYEPILGRYVAPLSLPVVLEIPYWTQKKDGIKITEDNAQFSITELALHGEEVYDNWAPEIEYACKRRLDFNVRVDSFPLALEKVTQSEWQL